MKKTFLFLVLALTTSAAWGFRYRIEGNVGTPDFTGWLYIQDQTEREPRTVDSLWGIADIQSKLSGLFDGEAAE